MLWAKPKGRKHRMLLFQLRLGRRLDLWFQKPIHGPEIVESSRELFQNIGSLAIHIPEGKLQEGRSRYLFTYLASVVIQCKVNMEV